METERTYRCPECLDRNWTGDDEDAGAPTLKPCRHCAPLVYARWRDGHYAPGHNCDECSAVRAGRVTVYDYSPEGAYLGPSSPGY